MKKVVKRGVRFVGWRVNDELELHAPWASPSPTFHLPTNRLTFGTNLISAGWSGLNNNKPVKNGGTIINWSCASLGLHTHYFLHWPINWKLILKFFVTTMISAGWTNTNFYFDKSDFQQMKIRLWEKVRQWWIGLARASGFTQGTGQ